MIEEVNLNYYEVKRGFSGGTSGKELTCQCRRHETWVQSLGWEDPLEEGTAAFPALFPGESDGQRSQPGYSPSSHKELDMTEVTLHMAKQHVF